MLYQLYSEVLKMKSLKANAYINKKAAQSANPRDLAAAESIKGQMSVILSHHPGRSFST